MYSYIINVGICICSMRKKLTLSRGYYFESLNHFRRNITLTSSENLIKISTKSKDALILVNATPNTFKITTYIEPYTK